MKLFSWLHDDKNSSFQNDGEDSGQDAEPHLSPALEERLQEIKKLKVRDVMVPRALVTALDVDVQLRRVRRLKSSKVTFFPVYKGDLDHILGWIPKQRVLELLSENSEDNALANQVRPVGSVSENTSASGLADAFLKAASPFLVVRDAQGSTVGIMPLADFVELIFGFELSSSGISTSPDSAGNSSLLRSYEL